MQEKITFFAQDFYEKHLSTINNVCFTNREIDVITCLVNAKGAKTTASLLGIKLSGVHSHLLNIRSKLKCNSGASIVAFIEDSGKLPVTRQYFYLLQSKIFFEKSLKDIAKVNPQKKDCCLYIPKNDKDFFIVHLKSHLELAGFSASISLREKKADYTLFILPPLLTETPFSFFLPKIRKSQNKVFLLIQEAKHSKHIPQELKKWDIIDFTKPENYFFSFFIMLQKLMPQLNLKTIIAEFTDKYKKIQENYKLSPVSLDLTLEKSSSVKKKWGYFLSICLLCILIGSGFLFFSWDQKDQEAATIRSDLIIPVELAFLNRTELITQIDNAFGGNEGIQTVALVGIGGSGKTTLARQYARQQKAPLIWEINAETKSNLLESFENLSYSLAKTEEDKRILHELAEIKNSFEREKRLVEFVKGHLKRHLNWLLIYDNLEGFTDVQKYFPLDAKTWGPGRVILTTQDSNIQNNKFVNHTLSIGELNENQKLDLFTKIMTQDTKNSFDPIQKLEVKKFLKNIPPFPLDVSVASYYIKTSNIPYEKYLEDLNKNNPGLTDVQNDILRESGDYTKTRYSIVILSLQKLMESHKDFADLLLFISLLDSQNIPKDLLSQYKDRSTVDSFIYHLKKYSLITNNASDFPPNLTFSIHRSSQVIGFSYLVQLLKVNKDSRCLKPMIYALDDYIDQIIEQEDFSKMHLMAPHLEKFLTHHDFLADLSRGLLESKLGSIYYFINNDTSKQMFRDSLNVFEKQRLENLSSEDNARLARSFLHIGAVYTELRLDKEAEEIFDKAVHIYSKEGAKNYTDLSWTLSHLGNLQRRLGHYEKAKDYLERSVSLHKQYGRDPKRIARTFAYLGGTYRGLGIYQKAIDNLEKSLSLYKENASNDHVRIGWPLIQLGNVYRRLGEPQKAKRYFERGLLIYKKHLPKNHMNMGLALACLGNCYRDLGDYEQSRDCLEQSLKIHQNYFDENHLRMGWILFYLASTYMAMEHQQDAQKLFDKVLAIYANHCSEENVDTADRLRNMAKICLQKNRLDDAEDFIKRSLQIFQLHHHVEAYRSLEVLGEIYLKKSFYVKNSQKIQDLQNQALERFDQASKIIEEIFPDHSTHIQSIKNKIKNIKYKK